MAGGRVGVACLSACPGPVRWLEGGRPLDGEAWAADGRGAVGAAGDRELSLTVAQAGQIELQVNTAYIVCFYTTPERNFI